MVEPQRSTDETAPPLKIRIRRNSTEGRHEVVSRSFDDGESPPLIIDEEPPPSRPPSRQDPSSTVEMHSSSAASNVDVSPPSRPPSRLSNVDQQRQVQHFSIFFF